MEYLELYISSDTMLLIIEETTIKMLSYRTLANPVMMNYATSVIEDAE